MKEIELFRIAAGLLLFLTGLLALSIVIYALIEIVLALSGFAAVLCLLWYMHGVIGG